MTANCRLNTGDKTKITRLGGPEHQTVRKRKRDICFPTLINSENKSENTAQTVLVEKEMLVKI